MERVTVLGSTRTATGRYEIAGCLRQAGRMVNIAPAEPCETDAEFRAWLLRRIDFLRGLVESGAPCTIADSHFPSHDDRRVFVAAFHFFEPDWIAAHQRRLREEAEQSKRALDG